jgi:arsenite methyltransferase
MPRGDRRERPGKHRNARGSAGAVCRSGSAVLEPEAGLTVSCGGTSAGSCCGTSSEVLAVGGFSVKLYREGETDGLPEKAVLASLGCGNPLAVADLHEGERVLDLGSGGGIDVLLSARRGAHLGSPTAWT